MKKYVILILSLLLISIPCVMAGTGSLRISPEWPTMLESPADFTVWCQNGISYDVEILLVITESCHENIGTNGIVIENTGSDVVFAKGDFTGVSGTGGVYVPPTGTTNGARYTVASLKDHLDQGLPEALESDDVIYWAIKPIFGSLGEQKEEITITLNSDNPRMLVYIMGKSVDNADLLDMRIPPTPAGFVIPEVPLGTIAIMSSMALALIGFVGFKRWRLTA